MSPEKKTMQMKNILGNICFQREQARKLARRALAISGTITHRPIDMGILSNNKGTNTCGHSKISVFKHLMFAVF